MHALTAAVLEKSHRDYDQVDPQCPFNNKGLPTCLILKIIRELDVKSQSSLALTCKKLYVLVQDDFMWNPELFSTVLPSKDKLDPEKKSDPKYKNKIQDEWIEFLRFKSNIDKSVYVCDLLAEDSSYTQVNSKVGVLARRRLEFVSERSRRRSSST